MKKTNYQVSSKTMQVAILKQAAMLKKYGINKPSEFEIAQLSKLGLTNHLNGVVVTSTGIVLCNWELVLIAKTAKVREITVTVIEDLKEDEIPQVIAVANIRKRLSKKVLGDLIVDYRDYLTKNEYGIAWAKEVPGDSTDAKIGAILSYSYGMINGYQKIYKYQPDYLKMMDNGEMSFTEAIKLIDAENALENGNVNIDNPAVPKKVAAPKHNYAGERNMEACTPMESIQIKYADGRTIDFAIEGNSAIGQLFNMPIKPTYTPKKEVFKGGAEYHRLDFTNNDKACFIELVIKEAA